ncbi:FAD/NAD(P)-binding domain-containing protein [Punctularia strigosozonata HHB-11173 SS5]|uniref:FAD/NAD(P)-binding domain-containing protein n=1 Tax=Punctularia strigosozonata (strain HHB-11173) TaxID=741275 RepID=UPI0004416426|nr:FAD/NAD(P)-binding domain-containing protein [Punctularia strigosozonata HHB-11173 SS5]EIN11914.1 FAD/NAD(P)-binding domain-containing protein [Punctularia strigosozonata HHB-11173 SS5]
MPRFRVAICGGGIGGLCLAVALSKYPDIRVDIYEAAERFKEIGAGVMIWSRTWRILQLLCLADQFSAVAHAPPDGSLGKCDNLSSFAVALMCGYGCIRFHRAHFLDVFVDNLPPDVAHFGKRVTFYCESPSTSPYSAIELTFSDGTRATCDVLIGCDGIKSLVRKQMYEQHAVSDPRLLGFIDPVWSGTIAYRGLIPKEELSTSHRAIDRPMMYCGKSKHVVGYSIAAGSIVNVITFASDLNKEHTPYDDVWVKECPKEELLDCYKGWEADVQELLTAKAPTKWALHALRPLPFYVSGRVALLGDAAHAMLPHQGAGAGQAIDDAYLLASILGNRSTTISTLPAALQAYQTIRLPMANHVLEQSRVSGMMYAFITSPLSW